MQIARPTDGSSNAAAITMAIESLTIPAGPYFAGLPEPAGAAVAPPMWRDRKASSLV
jgi:hypothetical protein